MPMGRIARSIGIALAACMSLPAVAAEPPNFGRSSVTGWIGYGPEYMPVEGAPRPVAADPAHPYIPNAIEYLSARPNLKTVEQSTFPVADLSNPVLQALGPRRAAQAQRPRPRGPTGLRAPCKLVGRQACLRFVLAVVNPIFFIQNADARDDDLARRRPYGPARISERAAFPEPSTFLVRRIGRPLRRRHACDRHDRSERRHLCRHLPHARIRNSCTSSSASA
jgi:hypothetical protein